MNPQTQYLDLNNGDCEPLFFFLLNAYLQSRIDTGNETDNETNGDEDVNMYIAGLLHSLVDGSFYTKHATALSRSPLDVCAKAERAGDRGRALVFRVNADHRLIALGLFSGFAEHTSLYRRTMTPDAAYLEEAQQFYAWAALFAWRMPPKYRSLATTLEKLANGFDTYHEVLLHMAGSHLNLVPRLSAGELFHLEREAHQAAMPEIRKQALDNMLDAYTRWHGEPTKENRQQFTEACNQYHQLHPDIDPGSLFGGDAN